MINRKINPISSFCAFIGRLFSISASGFSLVELLVVIAVIATVMIVAVPNFMGARERARDVQRKNDLSRLREALELYKSDQSPQSYPSPVGATGVAYINVPCNGCWDNDGNADTCTGTVYLRSMPCDPKNATPSPYNYLFNSSIDYRLSACLENPADSDSDIAKNRPTIACGSGVSYTVYTP